MEWNVNHDTVTNARNTALTPFAEINFTDAKWELILYLSLNQPGLS